MNRGRLLENRMSRSREILVLTVSSALGILLSGCQTQAGPASRPGAARFEIDPCADRLHDICGPLLLYYAAHKELPESLADLDGTGSDATPACPITRKPYVYNRNGLQVSGRPGRLIIYDAVACQSGTRCGILVETPRPGQPLVTRVIRVPETALLQAGQAEP